MSDREEVVKEASAKIAALLKEVQSKLNEATKIADDAQVEFTFDGPRESYGFGGWYNPRKPAPGWDGKSKADDDEDEDNWYQSGWQASSQSC